jgi:Flp pilus assembly protein protease CpaA
LNLNLNLPRSGGVFYNIFLAAATVVSYALTGWLTGMALAVFFNFIAKRMGGIDAKYVSVAIDEGSEKPQS